MCGKTGERSKIGRDRERVAVVGRECSVVVIPEPSFIYVIELSSSIEMTHEYYYSYTPLTNAV